ARLIQRQPHLSYNASAAPRDLHSFPTRRSSDLKDLGKNVEDREAKLKRGGLTIKSTVDVRMQNAINDAVTSSVRPSDRAIGSLALVEPDTGNVRGLAQSRPMGNKKK